MKGVFNPRDFDCSIFCDLFCGISADNERDTSSLFRIYIDGKLSREHQNKIHASPPGRGIGFSEWLLELMEGQRFGIMVNGVERWSDPLAKLAADLFAPIVEASGPHRTALETTLFIGNYGYTPFGIHIDDPFTSIVHFHVGPGNKAMTLFDKEQFLGLGDGKANFFDVDRLINKGTTYDIAPGDVFVLPPHYYHVGSTPELSIGVAITVSKYPEHMISKYVLKRAIACEALNVPLHQLIANFEATGETIANWLRRNFIDSNAQKISRGHLRHSYRTISSTDFSDNTIFQNTPMFPLTQVTGNGEISLYVRGNRVPIKNTSTGRSLCEAVCAGFSTFGCLRAKLEGQVSDSELRAVVRKLMKYGALSVATKERKTAERI